MQSGLSSIRNACNIYQFKKLNKCKTGLPDMSVLKHFFFNKNRNKKWVRVLVSLICGLASKSTAIYGHVGMLPPLYGTFTHYKNGMAIIISLKL